MTETRCPGLEAPFLCATFRGPKGPRFHRFRGHGAAVRLLLLWVPFDFAAFLRRFVRLEAKATT